MRTHAQYHVYLATEALSHTNEWSGSGGTVRGYGGPTVMLSALDGPPGPSVAVVHGPGDHPWLPHLVWGDRLWGTIDSVTAHKQYKYGRKEHTQCFIQYSGCRL